MMNYQAILFDMDGVLVLSEPVHYQAWLSVIADMNLNVHLPETEIIGITDSAVAEIIRQRSNTPLTPDVLCREKKTRFLGLIENGLPAVEGRDDFLKKASYRTRMAVVSSSSREEIQTVLRSSHIIDYFQFYLGFEDTPLHKPDPAPYLEAARILQCDPRAVLVIEDSPSGVAAARAAGARVAGINSSGLLDGVSGLPVFDDFHALSAWIERTGG